MKKPCTTSYHAIVNGMVEKLNRAVLNMLGTLEDNQKVDWKSHVSTMNQLYNAAVHDSTEFLHFSHVLASSLLDYRYLPWNTLGY